MPRDLTNKEAVRLVRSVLLSGPANPDAWDNAMDEMIDKCADDTDNWVVIFNCLAGVLTGVLLGVAEANEMNVSTVIKSLFNDEYASMLDYQYEIERLREDGGTDTGEGTDFVDRQLGDRQVDGLGEGQ